MSTRLGDCFDRYAIDGAVEIVLAGGAGADVLGLVAKAVPADAEHPHVALPTLPIAPRRWLWLNPPQGGAAELEQANAIIVDVDGKWVAYEGDATAAKRILSTDIDVGTVLEPRGCASATLFDCPVVIARLGADRLIVCVAASYTSSFEAATEQAVAAASGIVSCGAATCATMPS